MLPAVVIKTLVVRHTVASERYLMDYSFDGAQDFLLFYFPFHSPPTFINQPKALAGREGYHYQNAC